MTSSGQCPRGGGGACECLHPPPPPLQEILYPRACVAWGQEGQRGDGRGGGGKAKQAGRDETGGVAC